MIYETALKIRMYKNLKNKIDDNLINTQNNGNKLNEAILKFAKFKAENYLQN